MALANSGSISPQCNVIVHHLHSHGIEKQRNRIPPRLIQVELTIEFQILGHHNPMTNGYDALLFSSQQTLRFHLNVFREHQFFDQLLAPAFARLGINISLDSYNTILRQIRGFGFGIFGQSAYDDNRRRYCKALSIHSVIQATLVESEMMISAALAESASEFERSNFGVVAATQASIHDMLKRVRVEDQEENCTICMEQLEVGFEAYQMPCSHNFHADCIRKWLNLSHYCPNCRYAMPTD